MTYFKDLYCPIKFKSESIVLLKFVENGDKINVKVLLDTILQFCKSISLYLKLKLNCLLSRKLNFIKPLKK